MYRLKQGKLKNVSFNILSMFPGNKSYFDQCKLTLRSTAGSNAFSCEK